MNKKIIFLFVLCISLSLTGCDNWMDGEYHSVTPHLQQSPQPEDVQTVCKSYIEIRDSLASMVESGVSSGMIYAEGFTDLEMSRHMISAVGYVTKSTAIGAYAVDKIDYEIGISAATPAVAVEISYSHNRSQILRIKQAENTQEALQLVDAALDNFSDSVVMFVRHYSTVDIPQYVDDYVNNNPDICMEAPQVSVLSYPEQGTERVLEIVFTYQTSREDLRNMQQNVEVVFKSAELYVQGNAEDWEKYAQLYSFLMERYDYTIETSITPVYSLLRHGVGDSEAFSRVYAQMCRQAGLNCRVVTGTKAGEAWYWNLVTDNGVNYHIDLLACSEKGAFHPVAEEDMSGYVWDYSAYVNE